MVVSLMSRQNLVLVQSFDFYCMVVVIILLIISGGMLVGSWWELCSCWMRAARFHVIFILFFQIKNATTHVRRAAKKYSLEISNLSEQWRPRALAIPSKHKKRAQTFLLGFMLARKWVPSEQWAESTLRTLCCMVPQFFMLFPLDYLSHIICVYRILWYLLYIGEGFLK